MQQQPLFILTCMRSFSSMVCGMLGQHPQLYGLPELNLTVADHLRPMVAFFRTVRPASLHGLLRTIAQLQYGEQTDETIGQARSWLNQRLDWSTERMFHYLADEISPRGLVEKSPSMVMVRGSARRLRRTFPGAYYLHLTRHPWPACHSIVKLISEADEKRGTRRAEQTDPERLWLHANENALEFVDRLPQGQGMRLRGEHLLSAPETFLPQITEWLGIRSDAEAIEAMKHPENSPFARLGPSSARYGGDPAFMQNPYYRQREIPESSLDGTLGWVDGEDRYFSEKTRELAKFLGYSS
jgi:hypothetical protein